MTKYAILNIICVFNKTKLKVYINPTVRNGEYMEDHQSIGAKLRDLRNKNGLTQQELADRADLSKGFISQLENDLTSPSIATLIDILTLLGSSLKEFFSDDDASQIVFTEEDYFEKSDGSTLTTWIVPTAQKNEMEPITVEFEKGGATVFDLPHEGEEFGYVLCGKVQIIIGEKKVEASAGDSFYYKADKKHRIININDGKSKILWVSCPPMF